MKLDDIAWDLLDHLQADGRIGYAELGRRVGLSAPAVATRMKGLEEAGIIRGYTARLDAETLGLTVQVFVRMNVRGGPKAHREFLAEAVDVPEILDLWRLSGAETYLLRIVARSVSELENVLRPLWTYGETITSVVMSQPIGSHVITRSAVEGGPGGR